MLVSQHQQVSPIVYDVNRQSTGHQLQTKATPKSVKDCRHLLAAYLLSFPDDGLRSEFICGKVAPFGVEICPGDGGEGQVFGSEFDRYFHLALPRLCLLTLLLGSLALRIQETVFPLCDNDIKIKILRCTG